jgi:integrase
MQMEDHDEQDGRKVWLNEDEAENFILAAQHTQQRLAFGLMLRSGLRSKEATEVTPQDVTHGPAGAFLRVESGKGDKYRETPVPQRVVTGIETYADVRQASQDAPIVDVSTRTLQRWVDNAAAHLRNETDDDGWQYVSPHDLRRTWGTLLCEREVEPGLVMTYGGWEDWDTFREHYLGQYSVKAQTRAREKVPWL